MSRSILSALLCFFACISTVQADEEPRPQFLESQNDLGFVVPFHENFGQRFLGRLVLNDRDIRTRGELHYGLTWMATKHFSVDLTAGYAYDMEHQFVIGLWTSASFWDGRLSLHTESLNRFGGDGGRFDNFARLDLNVIGVHVSNRGEDVSAGFQIGSGYGLGWFRFEIFQTFGITDGLPERVSSFVMTFDVR